MPMNAIYHASVCLLLALVGTACHRPAEAAVAAQWACRADADCINSCSRGAVNRDWYRTAHVDECHDGCANQLAAPPRCIEQSCVAFARDPRDSKTVARSEYCTHKK